jgi:hypothetical protein
MGLNQYDYSPDQLLNAASVEVAEGCSRVSIGRSLDWLHTLGNIPDEFKGGCTGLDALCYHLSGSSCDKAIETLYRVKKRFKELEAERAERAEREAVA